MNSSTIYNVQLYSYTHHGGIFSSTHNFSYLRKRTNLKFTCF
jgi:hypothetical protein